MTPSESASSMDGTPQQRARIIGPSDEKSIYRKCAAASVMQLPISHSGIAASLSGCDLNLFLTTSSSDRIDNSPSAKYNKAQIHSCPRPLEFRHEHALASVVRLETGMTSFHASETSISRLPAPSPNRSFSGRSPDVRREAGVVRTLTRPPPSVVLPRDGEQLQQKQQLGQSSAKSARGASRIWRPTSPGEQKSVSPGSRSPTASTSRWFQRQL